MTKPQALTPLGHQWYRCENVVALVLAHYPSTEAATRELGYRKETAMLRRWHLIRTGRYKEHGVEKTYEWVSLLVVDKLLTALGLHIWHLGEPDLISATKPGMNLYQARDKLGAFRPRLEEAA